MGWRNVMMERSRPKWQFELMIAICRRSVRVAKCGHPSAHIHLTMLFYSTAHCNSFAPVNEASSPNSTCAAM
ncbi:hypothetical protein DMENIID0001_079470 [Sergentomyia squamirostris]